MNLPLHNSADAAPCESFGLLPTQLCLPAASSTTMPGMSANAATLSLPSMHWRARAHEEKSNHLQCHTTDVSTSISSQTLLQSAGTLHGWSLLLLHADDTGMSCMTVVYCCSTLTGSLDRSRSCNHTGSWMRSKVRWQCEPTPLQSRWCDSLQQLEC